MLGIALVVITVATLAGVGLVLLLLTLYQAVIFRMGFEEGLWVYTVSF